MTAPAAEVSRRQLKRLQRNMIAAGRTAKQDPTWENIARAQVAAVAYDRARHAWGR